MSNPANYLFLDNVHPTSTAQQYFANAALAAVQGTSVPEIDPNSLGSVLALVVGSLGLLERRRLRQAATLAA